MIIFKVLKIQGSVNNLRSKLRVGTRTPVLMNLCAPEFIYALNRKTSNAQFASVQSTHKPMPLAPASFSGPMSLWVVDLCLV